MIAVSDPIHLVRNKDARNHNGFGILVDRYWIEDGILARWKSRCISQKCCPSFHPPTIGKKSLFRPVWLFDTRDLRLVQGGRIKADYVALSYVWGTKPFFQTTKDHLARLLRPQSLLQLELLGVPRTIRDAIGVVNLLNERYLWVDALCIVQDDMHEKHSQINNMAAIFASAKVTIIAKQGADANFGLKGIRGVSQPRNLNQVKIMLEDGSVLIRGSRDGLSDPWSGRGWTFQEDYFSNRKIVFDQDSVAWECRCSKFREHLDTNPGAIQSRGISLEQNPKRLLLEDYNSLVAKYNFRTLTYPQDALAAFAGVTTALTKSFSGGFICGLPTLFIDQALCW
ncbi:heterokaryon incompatibility protein-domain-containing protein, partial [Bisporella sp. PMI_857]